MKKYNFQLTWLLIVMLIAACDNFTDKPQLPATLAPDSLLTPTGDTKLDSMLQLIAVTPQDTSLVLLYFRIAGRYENNDSEKAKEYYLKMGALSDRLNWSKGRLAHASGMAFLLSREGLTDSALVIYHQAIELAKNEKDELTTAVLLTNVATAYTEKNWYETALACYMEAIVIIEKEHGNNPQNVLNLENLLILYMNMSQIYEIINNTEKAIEYGEKAVMLESDNNKEFAHYALAKAYSGANQDDKAKEYYDEALRLCELTSNTYLMGIIYIELGKNALFDFDFAAAEKYLFQSMEINRESAPDAFCGSYLELSKMEQLKGHNVQSEKYAKEALQIATEYEFSELKKDSYQILASLAMAQGKYRESVAYSHEVDLAEKTIAKEKTLLAAEEMAAKYEAEKKDLEIKNQQNIINRQKMQRTLLTVGITACLVILVMLWYMLRLRSRRNRILAEINLTKDKFFNIISHDLKNPAISQRDTLNILVRNAPTWDADTLADYHSELLKSADGQVELIMNLLSWSKLQTGRMTCAPETFILSDLLPNLSLIRKMAENKHITLNIQIPENKLITADSNILATVIRNLMTNAIKFTPSGGQVSLSVEPTASNTYSFTVSDTGTGMSEKHFQTLFRLDSARSQTGTAGEQGSGLGLIVCRELLEKHGSTLHVESEEGKGCRFWFVV